MFWVVVFFLAALVLLSMGLNKVYRWWRPLSATDSATASSTADSASSSRSAGRRVHRSGEEPEDSERDAHSGRTGRMFDLLGSRPVIAVICVLLMAFSFWMTSVINPGGNQVAQFVRIYGCTAIKDGRNVALSGECGRQAAIRMPGFEIAMFVGVLNDVTYENMVDVPDGHYATLSARDGAKLEEGQVAARPWPLGDMTIRVKDEKGGEKDVTGNMLDATFFLTHGKGQKGPQATILPPGRYAINKYLWDVQMDTIVEKKDEKGVTSKALSDNFTRHTIHTGYVGVVRSALNEPTRPAFFSRTSSSTTCVLDTSNDTAKQLKAVLVPVGSRGVWNEALPPGDYFINRNVYQVEEHDTRMQNLILSGGYTRRYIDLKFSDSGAIEQVLREDKVPIPLGPAGPAIAIKVEGWTVWQELRIQFRTKPECAPLQAAAIGSLKEVDDRIIIPQAISVLRNIGGSNITVKNTTAYEEAKSELNALKARLEVLRDMNADVGLNPEQRAREVSFLERQIAGMAELPNPAMNVTRPTRVLDFQNEREALEKLVAEQIQNIGQEAGIEIVSVTFGEGDIPPELLVARKVEQLSGQLRNAFTQMRTAQVQRQATEAAKARADQQSALVTQQINTEKSRLFIDQRTNEGEAERRFNENDALGQQAQANVLGADKVMTIRIANSLIEAISKHPEILGSIKLPGTMVFGGGALDGPAAILKSAFGGPEVPAPAIGPAANGVVPR